MQQLRSLPAKLKPWDLLSLSIDSAHQAEAAFWWKRTAKILGLLMEEAGYDIESQYSVLAFHRCYVVTRLGPAKQSMSAPLQWRSLMTDDFSPLEYSWNWNAPNSRPQIRYSIEAIGSASGSATDPVNQIPSLELCQEVANYCPESDWALFNTLHQAFYDSHVGIRKNAVESMETSSSTSIMLAFELGPSIGLKAYFLPHRAEQRGITRLTLLKETMDQLRSEATPLSGFDTLLEYMKTSQGLKLEFLFMAIDCVRKDHSRYKIYLRSPETSFESVCDAMSLGGKIDISASGARQNLRDIWRHTLGLDEHFDESAELSGKSHETAGVLYYIDIKPGNQMPKSKVYIPVRHYASNDLEIAQGLGKYLHSKNADEYFPNFMRALKASCDHRQLSEGTGFQTYIGAGMEKDGSLSLCSYLNGEVYHPRRWN
jgi:DMATS type aromatic prenyltransferase